MLIFIRLRCEALKFCKFVFQPVFKMETVEEDMEIAEVNIRDLFTDKFCCTFVAVGEEKN